MPRKADPHVVSKDPSNLARYDRRTGVYGGRFPSSTWRVLDAIEGVASGPKNTLTFGNSTTGAALTDPYNPKDKAFFEDIFLSDGTAQEALMLLVKFVLGKKLQTVTEPREEYATEELRKQATESILNNEEYQKIHVQVKEIDKKVKLHERLMSSQAQKYAFGRSCLGVVVKEGLPVELKQFSSRNLGSAYVDKDWKLLGVEYEDTLIPKQNGKKQVFNAEDILYFTNLDYNIKPNTLFYGVSKLKALIGDSVFRRIVTEEDMPEVAKGLWATKAIIPVPNATQSKLNTLSDGFDPGKTNFASAELGQPVIIPAADNILELSQAVNESDIRAARAIGVPIQLIPGFEHITNRATTDTVVQGFMETRIEFERVVLQNQLQYQWYDTILMELLHVKDLENVEYKICLEYQNLILDTFKERCEGVKMMRDMGLPISDEAYLEMLGLDNLIDEIEEVKTEIEEKETEKMEMQAELLNKMPAKKPFGSSPK